MRMPRAVSYAGAGDWRSGFSGVLPDRGTSAFLAGGEARRPCRAGREQPHRDRSHRSQPGPDSGPQWCGAGHQLFGVHPRNHTCAGGCAGRHHQCAVEGRGDPDPGSQTLQAIDGGVAQFRVAAHSHPTDGRRGGPLHGAALPVSWGGHQGAALSQLSAGRRGKPCDWLHRSHQPGGEKPDTGLRRRGQLPWYRAHRQAGH